MVLPRPAVSVVGGGFLKCSGVRRSAEQADLPRGADFLLPEHFPAPERVDNSAP